MAEVSWVEVDEVGPSSSASGSLSTLSLLVMIARLTMCKHEHDLALSLSKAAQVVRSLCMFFLAVALFLPVAIFFGGAAVFARGFLVVAVAVAPWGTFLFAQQPFKQFDGFFDMRTYGLNGSNGFNFEAYFDTIRLLLMAHVYEIHEMVILNLMLSRQNV
ncbi:hypothetical protein B0H14DRAFT_2573366 [Mycena olivaceomarginata]|nr:hypothetical protein B0H14DRAFT_2573366 [Mycena olivaceomarginata]